MGCCAAKPQLSDDEEQRRNAPREPPPRPPPPVSEPDTNKNELKPAPTESVVATPSAEGDGGALPPPLASARNINAAASAVNYGDDYDTSPAAILALGAMAAVAGSAALQYLDSSGMPRPVVPTRQPVCEDPNNCASPCVMRNVDNISDAFTNKRYVWVEGHEDLLSVNARPDPNNSASSIDDRENYDLQGGFAPQRKQ